jgi:protein phosphatase
MGSTIVAGFTDADRRIMHIAYVGDSRCYRLRDGRLEQLTQDHTLANDVLELSPQLDEAEALKLPRNVITRALGMSKRVRVSVRTVELVAGDRYLFCTDGLTRVVDDHDIRAIMRQPLSAPLIVVGLLEASVAGKTPDNVAVVVLLCDQKEDGTEASRQPVIRGRASEIPPADVAMLEPDIEIAMVDFAEAPPARDSGPEVVVVPAETHSAALIRAIQGVVVPMVPTPRPALDTMPHTDVTVCAKCYEIFELTLSWCPHCGEPLDRSKMPTPD